MPVLKQRVYGTGMLVITPAAGMAPIVVASLQNTNLTVKGELTELPGPNRMAEDLALGKLSIDGDYQSGAIRSGLIAGALPGGSLTTGMFRQIYQESSGVIVGATFTAAHTTGFVCCGLYDETGLLMTPSVGAPAAGQYQVTSGGVYTLHSGATGKTYTHDYLYADAASGWTYSFKNQLQGAATGMALYLANKTKTKEMGCKLYSVILPEFSLAMKLGDWALPKGSFKAFADSSDNTVDFWGE